MKYLSLIALILFSCSKPDHTPLISHIDKLELFMEVTTLSGQSNMGGTIYTKVVAPSPGVNIMAYNTPAADSFQILQRGVNASYLPYFYGIQSILGDSLTKYRGKDVYLFQPAYGGTAIAHWGEGQKMWKYIEQSIPAIRAFAQSKNKVAAFKYTVWYQGEADAATAKWDSAVYRKQLESFIDRYRALLQYDTKFIIVEFPDAYKAIPAENLKQIRAIQRSIGSQRNNELLEAEVSDKCVGDNIHLTKETYVKKSNQLFKIIR